MQLSGQFSSLRSTKNIKVFYKNCILNHKKRIHFENDCSKWILYIYANMGVQEDLLINLFSKLNFSAPFYFCKYTTFFAYILLINPTMLIKIMAATLVAILNCSLSLKTLTTQTTKKITNNMFLKLFAIDLIVNILSL